MKKEVDIEEVEDQIEAFGVELSRLKSEISGKRFDTSVSDDVFFAYLFAYFNLQRKFDLAVSVQKTLSTK